jgi:large repetitive protein
VTDSQGEFVFSEVFPFFKWIVAESDYTRFKPTGATVYVDKGGPLVNGTFPLLETRTDTGPFPFLLEGMILYNGNNAKIDWARVPYAPGENGGIVGVAYLATTRAQADPRLSVAEPWEPGIPDVTINLYRVTGYDVNGKPITQGPINTYQTDSWDKSLPTGCKSAMTAAGLSLNPQGIPMDKYIDCAETIPFWNQTKPAVFDGGYAFSTDDKGNPLPAGDYVVEAIIPPGYILEKEEDVNAIVQGDTYTPSVPQPALIPAECVGADHLVPTTHSFDGSTIDASSPVFPYVGLTRPLCDKKLVRLADGQNAAADFHFWTFVPPAGRIVGLVTDDLNLEFRRGSPRLSDKIGVPFLPVSFKDFKGHEVARTYSDEWGQYNALVPSTYSVNVPLPTGVAPNIVQIFLNDPGPDPAHPDPYYNPGYPVISVNMDVWPGKTTYADTPIVPIRPNYGTLDCDLPDKTPVIFQVNGPAGGPWVETSPGQITITSYGTKNVGNLTRDYGFGNIAGTVFATPVGDLIDGMTTKRLQISSWNNGTITLTGNLADSPTPIPAGAYQLTVRRGDSYMTSINGVTLHVGVPAAKVRFVLAPNPDPNAFPGAIQTAIDSANTGDLILVAPGLYPENILMYKNVKLQGYGADSTIVNAGYFGPSKQTAWLAKLNSITTNQTDPLYIIPGERPDFFLEQGAGIMVLAREGDFTGIDPARIDGLQITGAIQGGGIFVNGFAHYLQLTNNKVIANQATVGGGIRIGNPGVVNPGAGASQFYQSSFNDHISMSYNQVVTNGANGITIASGAGIGLFTGSDNYLVSDSWICGNYSALAGAGIAHQGLSDHGMIRGNRIVFNESFDEGAGILLAGETPLTNLLGPEGEPPVPGAPLLTPGVGNIVINGNLIQGNKGGNIGGGITLLQYNGLDVLFNPGNTLPTAPGDPVAWYRAEIYNNMIVNNISGAFGAGIAIIDALDTVIVNNTISNNDSTATSEFAFGSVPNPEGQEGFVLAPTALTFPMPAGIGIQPFSANLISVMTNTAAYGAFGGLITPVLINNIVTNNFAYYWNGYNAQNSQATLSLAGVWDMGVFGVPGARPNPRYSLLTNLTNYPDPTTNLIGDPKFLMQYRNNISATQGGAALGNFVSFTYTPQTLVGNYHIQKASPAVDSGDPAAIIAWGLHPPATDSYLDFDTDMDKRSSGYANPQVPDRGADEFNARGDVDGDGQVTMQDVLLALTYVVDNTKTPAYPLNANVDPLTPTGKPLGHSGAPVLLDVLDILMRATGMLIW